MALNYFFPNEVWMVIIRSVFLIPQIIFNALMGNNPGFNPFYILGYVGIRILIPLYTYSCPENRFLISPNITLVVIILSIFVFEVICILYRFWFWFYNINWAHDFLFQSNVYQSSSIIGKRLRKIQRIKIMIARFAFKTYFPVT